jgi:hypothetical protein
VDLEGAYVTAVPVSATAQVRPYRWALIGALVLCSTALIWYGFTIGVLLPDISDAGSLIAAWSSGPSAAAASSS